MKNNETASHPSPDLTRLKQALADEICDDKIINRLPLQDLIWLNGLILTALTTAVSAATEPLRREVEKVNGFREELRSKFVRESNMVGVLTQELTAARNQIAALTAEINRLKGEK